MPRLSGILGNTYGSRITIRGYATYKDILKCSYSDETYQRPCDLSHVDEIKRFIINSDNTFSPEVVLGYTLSSPFLSDSPEISSPLENILEKKGCTFQKDSVNFKYNKTKDEYTITFPVNKKIFRRIDGNHRLLALEAVIKEKQSLEGYKLPFCIILFEDNTSSKQDEKTIFYNINSKALPVQTEHMLSGIIPEGMAHSFNDDELKSNFGIEYLIVRKIEQTHPALIKNVEKTDWAKGNVKSILLHLVKYASKVEGCDLPQPLEQDNIATSIHKAFEKIVDICGEKTCYSGVIFALTKLFLQSAHGEEDAAKKISCFTEWIKRNDLFTLQPNDPATWEINADNILQYFEKHLSSQYHTIFMSRCFADEYNAIEETIRRAIDETNKQFAANIKLQRVDRHEEGCSGDILLRVQEMMSSCGLVIADLSSGKPNVHHEIGLAMGMKKPIILLHRGLDNNDIKEHIPSNISMMDQIRFDTHDYKKLEQDIKQRLQDFYRL